MVSNLNDCFEFLLLRLKLVFGAVDLQKPGVDIPRVAVAGVFSGRDAGLRRLGIKNDR